MNLRFVLLVFACVALCAAVMAYKVTALGYRLDSTAGEDRWSVQVTLHGEASGERTRFILALPSGAGDQLYDERFSYPGQKLSIRTRSHERTATFTSESEHPQGTLSIVYRFSRRVAAAPTVPARATAEDTASSAFVPADDPAVRAKAKELTATATDDASRVRDLYDFVLDEVTSDAQTTDVMQALIHLHGDAGARTRLFVALVRSLDIPARLAHAVALVEGANRPLLLHAEVLLDDRWVGVDPVRGRFGADVEEGVVLGHTDGEMGRAEGLRNAEVDVAVARESVNEYEQFQRRIHSGEKLLDWLSFYALPPRSQLVFRVLLLVPLGALIVSVFRNLVGISTFGTFIPILIALALRETKPLAGLLMLAIVVGSGLLGRAALDRLRLLIVPRLSLLLTFVIFIMALVALIAARLDANAGLSVALLPMVIMTMTIERLSVMVAEEGYRPALRTLAGTVFVAGVGYAAIQSELLQKAVFTFPELNLIVVALLLLLGRYTGYRLSERIRFRTLAKQPQPELKP